MFLICRWELLQHSAAKHPSGCLGLSTDCLSHMSLIYQNLIWLTSLFSGRFTEKILSSSAETSLQKACGNSVFPSQCSYCLTYTIFMSWSKYSIINEMTVTFDDHHFRQLSLLIAVTFQDCYFVRTLFCWDLFFSKQLFWAHQGLFYVFSS